jgi:hypothetical protein
MKLPRRKFLHLAAGAAALPAVSRIARAQAYPSRTARIVVTFPAGSTSDILARPIAQWLHDRLGQPFIIDNRPGAGGTIGTEAVSFKPWRNARRRSANVSGDVPPRNPITGITACCARTTTGHATAAPPSSVKNSRRFTARCLLCFRTKGIAHLGTAGDCCAAGFRSGP